MKRIKYILSVITVTLFLCLGCAAISIDRVSFPNFPITVNGTEIQWGDRQYPLIVHKDITYFPMTYYDCRFLGLVTEWDTDTKTLSISKENISGAYRDYECLGVNGKESMVSACLFNIVVNGKEVDNYAEEYPLLTFRDVTYFPLTWRFCVDEFGWEYSFDNEKGLVINSNNKTARNLGFPLAGGCLSWATDGEYYYYTGNGGRIFRTPVGDLSEHELIHVIPKNTGYADIVLVDFDYSNENVFFTYHIGGASTGTNYRYKINGDGSCVQSTEGNYRKSSIGANCYVIDGDGFTIETYNSGHVGTSVVYLKPDGLDEYTEIKLEGIRFGEYKNVDMNVSDVLGSNEQGNVWFNNPVLLGSAVYVTGYSENEHKNSDLYRYDMTDGNIEKVAENVTLFHVFTGWDNDVSADSEMVIFDREGNRYRYSHASKECKLIDENVLPMVCAAGDYSLVVAANDGEKSAIYAYDSYGTGSLKTSIFEGDGGFEFYTDNGVIIGKNYSSADIKSVFAKSSFEFTQSCDLYENIFVYDNIVFATVEEKLIGINLGEYDHENNRIPEKDFSLEESNKYRPNFGIGTCNNILAPICINVIFVEDDESKWDAQAVEHFKENLFVSLSFLDNQANEYGHTLYYKVNYIGDNEDALKYTGTVKKGRTEHTSDAPDNISKVMGYSSREEMYYGLSGESDAEQNVFVFALNKDGTCYAMCDVSDDAVKAMEHVVLFTSYPGETTTGIANASRYAHEFLHLFGAEDYYNAGGNLPNRKSIVDRLYRNDIMNRGFTDVSHNNIGEVTAFAIGFTDKVPHVCYLDEWWS